MFACLKIQLASEFVQSSRRLLWTHDVPTVEISKECKIKSEKALALVRR